MSSESALQTSKEQLTAQQKITEDDGAKRMKLVEKLQSDFQVERNELNSKLQELLMHNEKSKDECLKKVIVYREKYSDYKNKVKQANQKIQVLMQRMAAYEIEAQRAAAGPDAEQMEEY